ncbi:MAG: 5-formyltetrahydrofolate cyclo-ligase [Pseudomonadota bacterium]
MTKAELRRAVLAERDGLAPEFRQQASSALVDYVDQLPLEPSCIASAFLPIRSEIDLQPLMKVLAQRGVPLCLPVVLDRETIVFRRYDRKADLVDTGFGTRGPGPEAETVDPDVMLVPLAAFDCSGNRIGYGAGHYDRAVARLTNVRKKPQLIGCAFACQEVESIPAEPHDVPLDAVLSEEGFRRFHRDP